MSLNQAVMFVCLAAGLKIGFDWYMKSKTEPKK